MKTNTVLHLNTSNPAALKYAISNKSPIKVNGLINHWPASKWTFNYLIKIFGKKLVKVLTNLPNQGGVLSGGQASYESIMVFDEFIRLAFNEMEKPCYMGYTKATDILREHTHSYNFSELAVTSDYASDTRLWIGSKNTCSGLHSDLKDNIFVQIAGTKKVFLVPFYESHLVYPFIDNIVNSRINPEEIDLAKYPEFQKATLYSTIVEPGDVMFIPRGWWHYLRSLQPSISINHWFGEPIPSATYLRLLMKLGPAYICRAIYDLFRYSLLGDVYQKDFFFTPASTGERLFNLIRHGDFSWENNPSALETKIQESRIPL